MEFEPAGQMRANASLRAWSPTIVPMVRAYAWSLALRLCVVVVCTWTLLVAPAGAQDRSGLESFYVTSSNSRIVHVEPADGGVKVRVIEVGFYEGTCGWSKVVRARDAVLPGLDVAALAGAPVCSMPQRRIDRALERSREEFIRATDGIPTGVNINTVVASCGGRERRIVFDNHMKRWIDEDALKRFDRQAYELWTLSDRILARVSGSGPNDEAQQALGTVAAADLIAGKYDGAYRDMCWDERGNRASCSPKFWTQTLGQYTGPEVERQLLPVELADQSSWQFAHYVPPVFPPIALSARLFRDVRLRLEVARESGAVTDATVVDGNFLLNEAALTAARQWRFVPGTYPIDPFEVTVAFALRCSA